MKYSKNIISLEINLLVSFFYIKEKTEVVIQSSHLFISKNVSKANYRLHLNAMLTFSEGEKRI